MSNLTIRIIQSEETKDKKYKLVPEAVIPDGNLELYTPLAGTINIDCSSY